jgi:hypothetical protein
MPVLSGFQVRRVDVQLSDVRHLDDGARHVPVDRVRGGARVAAVAVGAGTQARPPPLGPQFQDPQEQIGRAERESACEQSDREGQEEEQENRGAGGESEIPGRLRQR